MKYSRVFLLIALLGFIVVPASFAQDMTEFQKQMQQQMMQQNMQRMQSGETQPPLSMKPPGPESSEAVNQGKKIFIDPSLGTNGKSCGSCHREGEKPLAGQKVNNHMIAYVQYCYEHAIGGEKVIDKSKLDKLMAYFRSLQKSAPMGVPPSSPPGDPSFSEGEEEAW